MHWQAAMLLAHGHGDKQSATALHLGRNIQTLREARGLTQQQIAALAGIPRATWANLESGAANPTLAVLIKVAQALQVRLEELIEPPRRTGRLYRAAALPSRDARAGHRAQAPARDHRRPGDRAHGAAAARGDGRRAAHAGHARVPDLRARPDRAVGAGGESFTLEPGDVVVFRGDQKHGYRNPGATTAVAYSVVAFAPVGN